MRTRQKQFASDTLDLLKMAQGLGRSTVMSMRPLTAKKTILPVTSQSRGFFTLNQARHLQ